MSIITIEEQDIIYTVFKTETFNFSSVMRFRAIIFMYPHIAN